ncbi:MAG: hypothetical protein QOG87_198 [Actinomycetota bacterium]|jgi:uncharacterized protein YndB with AHSA1/START domain
MTTPDVPLRLERTFEVQGTPAQVWEAIATADGISSWFIRTEVEEREGGAIVVHMGDDMSSEGTVTGWDPPQRFAYIEPDWAALSGHEGAEVSPMATEFLVEATSGGTCVVRIVTSAFGTGAEWEQEFWDEMERMWVPFFDRLRLYLTHFPGQTATSLDVNVDLPTDEATLQVALRRAVGADAPGQSIDVRGLTGLVEQVDDVQMLVRLTGPLPGVVAFVAFAKGPDVACAAIQGYFFSDDAPAYVERITPEWKAWLESLGVSDPDGAKVGS